MTAPETAPSATETGKRPTRGLCHCPPDLHGLGNLGAPCECMWGALIGALRQLAYAQDADQALRDLPHHMMWINSRLADIRQAELADRAARWEGEVNGFMDTYQITRGTLDRLGIKVNKS